MWTVSGTLWCFLQRRHLLIKSLFFLNENSEITEAEQETASRKCLPHSLHSQGFCLLCNEKTMYINETKLPLLSVL